MSIKNLTLVFLLISATHQIVRARETSELLNEDIRKNAIPISPLRQGEFLFERDGWQTTPNKNDDVYSVMSRVFDEGLIDAKYFVVRDMTTLARWVDLAAEMRPSDVKRPKASVASTPASRSR